MSSTERVAGEFAQEAARGERILHLLCPVDESTPSDARLIPGDCGHDCTGSEQTHKLLEQPGDHLVYCLPCFMAEHD